MRRTYARFASPPARTATSNAGDGGGVIAAKDRPGNLTGASDQQVVAWAKQGYETPQEMQATALQLGDRAESPLQELEARELGGAIERAIARLRPEYRACILLRHVEGFSYEEIAQTLDLPLGTVKTYIHRARNELRSYLEDRRA